MPLVHGFGVKIEEDDSVEEEKKMERMGVEVEGLGGLTWYDDEVLLRIGGWDGIKMEMYIFI